jgi:hypothetical protein
MAGEEPLNGHLLGLRCGGVSVRLFPNIRGSQTNDSSNAGNWQEFSALSPSFDPGKRRR